MRLSILALILLLTPGLTPQGEPSRTVPIGEEFTLRFGERVSVEGTSLRISFVDVLEDSRCPSDVVCVWQGNAKINLEFRKKRKKVLSALLNSGLSPNRAEYRGFEVKLVKLEPNPTSQRRIEKPEYVATLVVTEIH